MRHRRHLAVVFPLALTAACSQKASPLVVPPAEVMTGGIYGDFQPTAAQTAEFQEFLSAVKVELTAAHAPGASVAVVLNGQVAFAAGVGLSDIQANTAVTPATLFRVASMSKMVAAATAMSLVEAQKLDLNAPITQYLPWFQLQPGFEASQLTMSLLMSRTSGFPCDTIEQCGNGFDSARQTFFSSSLQPLWHPPGAAYDYSNAEFALAGTVMEAADGLTDGQYEQLAHDHVFVPAGMTTATFDPVAATAGDHAVGYEADSNGNVTELVELESQACPLLNPPSGIMATATDYAHFAATLLAGGGTMLTPESVATMEAAHADMGLFPTQEYCYGLRQQEAPPYSDHLSVWHDGNLNGYTSELWMIPDDGFAVVALVNSSAPWTNTPDNIVGDALNIFIGEARVNPDGATAPASWSQYVGTYDDHYATLGAGVTVTLTESSTPLSDPPQLVVDAPNSVNFSGQPAPVHGPMTQSAVDGWVMPDGTFVTFFPDASGTMTYFTTRRGVGVRE